MELGFYRDQTFQENNEKVKKRHEKFQENLIRKENGDSSFFSQTPERSLENLRAGSVKPKDNLFGAMDLKLGSNFKIHGGQRAHKIKPNDNIGLDFLGQDEDSYG